MGRGAHRHETLAPNFSAYGPGDLKAGHSPKGAEQVSNGRPQEVVPRSRQVKLSNCAFLPLWARLCSKHRTSVLAFGHHCTLAAMPLCPSRRDNGIGFAELHFFNLEVNS